MNKATFPITQNKFYSPILRLLSDSKVHKIEQIRQQLADNFHLTEKELKMKLPSGDETVFANRFRWARNDLIKYGYVESPEIGELKITQAGLKLFKQKKRITKDRISKVNQLSESKETLPSDSTQEKINIDNEIENQLIQQQGILPTESPDDQINEVITKAQADLPNKLIKLLRSKDPTFFEVAVNELIQVIYKGKQNTHEGGPGDGGIDGIIEVDDLGLDVIYIQAKRYQEGNLVGESELQKFVGALARHHATRGVFITASDFHHNTIQYVKSLNNQPMVKLINGMELVQKMIKHQVGIKTTEYKLKGIKDEYFDSTSTK